MLSKIMDTIRALIEIVAAFAEFFDEPAPGCDVATRSRKDFTIQRKARRG